MILPGFNYSEDLMLSVRSVGNNYFQDTRFGAFIESFTETVFELQEDRKEDKAVARSAVDEFGKLIEASPEFIELGLKGVEVTRKVSRTAKRIAKLTPLVAADGPLPVGDIVYIGLSMIEIGLLTYDIITDVKEWFD